MAGAAGLHGGEKRRESETIEDGEPIINMVLMKVGPSNRGRGGLLVGTLWTTQALILE